MKAVWIFADANGASRIKPLPLVIPHLDDPKALSGPGEAKRKTLITSPGMRCARFVEDHAQDWAVASGRHFNYVISGSVELTVADGQNVMLQPGDVYFEADLVGKGHKTAYRSDCRVMRVGVSDSWNPEGEAPLEIADGRSERPRQPNLQRMYTAKDEKSYFRAFDELFSAPSGVWTPIKPILGFRFCSFAPGFFIDWHPEAGNQLVMILTGTLELEVGGGEGEISMFGPGDICLAEDLTGQGHIDRMHGHTTLSIILIEDEHLWRSGDHH